jgi:plasmid stabilization system protein ParE
MSFSVIFHPLAQQELIDAYLWYCDKGETLGERFMEAIERRLEELRQHPDSYPAKHRIYREIRIFIFPYVLVYTCNKQRNEVQVKAVFHTSRNPLKKYRR